MSRFRLHPLVLLLALGACAAPGDQGDAAPAPSEATRLSDAHRIAIADSVRLTLDNFVRAVGAMDPEAIATYYADDPDMRWIEDGEVAYRSPREVAEAIRQLSQTMSATSLTYDGTEIVPVAPGVAVVVTGFAQQFTTLGGETGGFAGAITAVMVNRGGLWLFLSGHTSSAGNRAGAE